MLYIARSESRAERLADAVAGLDPDVDVILLPAWDCLPYDRFSPSAAVMARRIAALSRLSDAPGAAGRLVVATVEAALQRVSPPETWQAGGYVLDAGARLSAEELKVYLVRAGYVLDDVVDEPGEAAFRGTIDLFPGLADRPIRLRLENGVIGAIDRYDPSTQRSEGEVGQAMLQPVSELVLDADLVRRFLREEPPIAAEEGAAENAWRAHLLTGTPSAPRRAAGLEHALPLFQEQLRSLFDLVPDAPVLLDPEVEERCDGWLDQIAEAFRHRISMPSMPALGDVTPLPVPPPDRLYLDAEAWAAALGQRRVLELTPEAEGAVLVAAEPVPRFIGAADPARALAEYVHTRSTAGDRVVLCGASTAEAQRLSALVQRRLGQPAVACATWRAAETLDPGTIATAVAPLPSGFATEGLAVVAFADAFPPRDAREAAAAIASPLTVAHDLRLGDLVVHPDHGIATLAGLQSIDQQGTPHACLVLEFAEEEKLLVPAADIARLWRYGSADAGVAPDRLSGQSWEKRRAAVEAAIDETARGLVALARSREQQSAPRLVPPAARYRRFAVRFPYAETPDQRTAIAAVLDDLASGRPMNRLVCGDVGFGKTEVAVRAAAAAVMAGKQVALLAPTRILARQHLETFRRRFAGFDVRIEAVMRTSRVAAFREIVKGAADGSIGILIGTHVVASEKLRFQDLGLVIIDEEQRFGQQQKDRIRDISAGLHVLAMSATPIPRTLQSALAGVTDLSIIATPPVRRRPGRTFVVPFEPAVVREALMRERSQGGQSFVVCPRIADLEPMRAQLAELVPDLDLAVAHGRMRADTLEETVLAFADGAHDVLLTTDIIESGLDIPNANTMLVWRADRFGLAELHQLRGRVGRGRRRGIVFLLTERGHRTSAATRKRLETLQTLQGLGAGFAIGTRDLDLRGAGDLLGADQSGHLRLIGTALYQDLLERAMRRARGEPVEEAPMPEMNIGLSYAIPEEYVPEDEVRLNLYSRLAQVTGETPAAEFAEELADRFGPAPDSVTDMLTFVLARAEARDAGIVRVDAGPEGIALMFRRGDPQEQAKRAAQADFPAARCVGERLVVPVDSPAPRQRLALLRRLIASVADGAPPQARQACDARS